MRDLSRVNVRKVSPSDWNQFNSLEQQVWGEEGVETVPKETFLMWIKTDPHTFLGAFEDSDLLGYAYCTRIEFNTLYVERGIANQILETNYKKNLHFKYGNSLLGVSIAIKKKSQGIGSMLIKEMITQAKRDALLKYIVCGVRLSSFSDYVKKHSLLHSQAVAGFYASEVVRKLEGFIHKGVRLLPLTFPIPDEYEPVLDVFVRKFKFIYAGIAQNTGYHDEKSLNYAGVIFLPL